MPVFAEVEDTQCTECRERKASLCDEECELVEDKRLECIYGCVKDYCIHKCPEFLPSIPSFPTTPSRGPILNKPLENGLDS